MPPHCGLRIPGQRKIEDLLQTTEDSFQYESHKLVANHYYLLNIKLATLVIKYELRVVTKISSCRVNTTNRRGIKQLGGFFRFDFSFIFL